MPPRDTPPFRADHVGSLLRPPELARARAAFRAGELDASALRAAEDAANRDVIALQYVPLEQLCLSGQCGFSSTEQGNRLTIDEQRRKLELIVSVADTAWGR